MIAHTENIIHGRGVFYITYNINNMIYDVKLDNLGRHQVIFNGRIQK